MAEQLSASSTDFETIQGQLTLSQLISEIELISGSLVDVLQSGSGRRGPLLIYRRNGEPLVDPSLIVNVAVEQREADSVAKAQARTTANLAIERRQIKPKKAERYNSMIYFSVVCEDNETYSVSVSL